MNQYPVTEPSHTPSTFYVPPPTHRYMVDQATAHRLQTANQSTPPDPREPADTEEQKRLIDQANQILYYREPIIGSNSNLAPVLPIGAGSSPLATATMLSNHANHGYDPREFAKQINASRDHYDPYLGYLHHRGLIGLNTPRYTTHHINIDTMYLRGHASCEKKYICDPNPLYVCGTEMRVSMRDTGEIEKGARIWCVGARANPVSYTHLTLPTSDLV